MGSAGRSLLALAHHVPLAPDGGCAAGRRSALKNAARAWPIGLPGGARKKALARGQCTQCNARKHATVNEPLGLYLGPVRHKCRAAGTHSESLRAPSAQRGHQDALLLILTISANHATIELRERGPEYWGDVISCRRDRGWWRVRRAGHGRVLQCLQRALHCSPRQHWHCREGVHH